MVLVLVKVIEPKPRRSVLPRHFPGISENNDGRFDDRSRLMLKTIENGFSGNDSDECFRGGWGTFLIVKVVLIPLCPKHYRVFGH